MELGRYEFRSGTSSKYWQIQRHAANVYRAEWGRIGSGPQGEKTYSEAEAYKKIREKISKGYQLVDSIGRKPNFVVVREQAQERVSKKRAERKQAMDFITELRKIK